MLNDSVFLTMAVCLALTIVIEGVFAWLLGARTLHAQMTVLMANVMTNPPVVSINLFCAMRFGSAGYYISMILLEALAFWAESMVYRRNPPCGRNPYLLSGVLNVCSFSVGIVLNMLIF